MPLATRHSPFAIRLGLAPRVQPHVTCDSTYSQTPSTLRTGGVRK